MNSGLQVGLFRRVGVRLVHQANAAEAGLASLAMVANYHGIDANLNTLRRRFQPSLRGISFKTLVATADQIGLSARQVTASVDQLAELRLPAVLHWGAGHFVVLERMRRGRAFVHDPAGHSRWWNLAELSHYFSGLAVELHPVQQYRADVRREKIHLPQLWQGVSGAGSAISQTIALSLVMQAFTLCSPYYMQMALDSALPALDNDLLLVLALGFGLFTLINIAASFLRGFVLLNAGSALGFGVTSNIGRRLFRLPVTWFEKRHIGDILSRFGSVRPIQTALTQGAMAVLLDGTLAVLILLIMFFYSSLLTFVALGAFLLYALVRAVSFSLQRNAQEEAIAAGAKEQSTLIESVRGIVPLRLFNREAQRHALWQGCLTDTINAQISLGRIGIWQQATNSLVFGIEAIFVVWLAIGYVIAGGFSVGMVFAYLTYKGQFMQRAASLVDQVVELRMLSLHLDRLSDIALADEDSSFSQQPRYAQELKGAIELRGISFRYDPGDALVLDGLNLTVEPGEHVAITGASGGGKSTLLKILLGLTSPERGEVHIDGVALNQFGIKNYQQQIAAVLQDDHLFAGSLLENIALFDDAVDIDRVVASATAAAIHPDIMAMPMGYDTLVGDMGSTLSGGQRQRVLLARALYREPKILLMDEGTSQLDTETEARVNASIRHLGITRVVVAHRTETIIGADRVFELTGGALLDISPKLASLRSLP